MSCVEEGLKEGLTQAKACELIGISQRTYQRWKAKGLIDCRQMATKRVPSNKLTDEEKSKILEVCNTPEFASSSVKQIVPALADKGIYLASESSFYRILREANQLAHRGRSKPDRKVARPKAYTATAANQVWSWDITYLASSVRGVFYYLYAIVDIYSRKIVGWDVYECESSDYASEVLYKAKLNEKLKADHQLVLHSDNGSPMKGATMLATMQSLGVMPSFSRPSVSNDNPYSEALFKTLKYNPSYPGKPFADITQARQWVSEFVDWYNNKHRHSALKYVSPQQRHTEQDIKLLDLREKLYQKAKNANPSRWSGNTRNWRHQGTVYLNKVNEQAATYKMSA